PSAAVVQPRISQVQIQAAFFARGPFFFRRLTAPRLTGFLILLFPLSASAFSRPNSFATYLSLQFSEQKCTARRWTACSLSHAGRIVTSRRAAIAPTVSPARPTSHTSFRAFILRQKSQAN